jgi:hypothetical protein
MRAVWQEAEKVDRYQKYGEKSRSVLTAKQLQDAQKGYPFAPAHPGAPRRAFHRIRPQPTS